MTDSSSQGGDLVDILPKALEWANEVAEKGMLAGRGLTRSELVDASHVGVAAPERIRLVLVNEVPMPTDPVLRDIAVRTGLLNSRLSGLTLGYAIFMVPTELTRRLLTHECRHVFQYERAGSIDRFLPEYLHQITTYGYSSAPLELDASMHELR
ncbi:hypothetical protein E2P84_37595 [Burkholderia cepacia]|uniref:hypothetical protein n=1 Tax=Burkholderia cepacia TaxID=292 RepID=UPI001067B8C1|nr:hypothetical protein [Burkholderia cepacia]TES64753.1 hypothetical protein E2P84_37595 [Burkholderia cepacia]